MTDKPTEQNPATSRVRDSIRSKIDAFDSAPDEYQGTADLAAPNAPKEETDGTED